MRARAPVPVRARARRDQVGDYYKGGLAPVSALVMGDYDRAAPLGVGAVKVAGNYAADLLPNALGKAEGYPIALYLDAAQRKYVEEFSTSNFVGITGDGAFVTPDSPAVLPSITNKSLMQLAEEAGLRVERRPIEYAEVEAGAFEEVAAVGTAVVITPVGSIASGDAERRVTTIGDGGVGKTWRPVRPHPRDPDGRRARRVRLTLEVRETRRRARAGAPGRAEGEGSLRTRTAPAPRAESGRAPHRIKRGPLRSGGRCGPSRSRRERTRPLDEGADLAIASSACPPRSRGAACPNDANQLVSSRSTFFSRSEIQSAHWSWPMWWSAVGSWATRNRSRPAFTVAMATRFAANPDAKPTAPPRLA